MKIAKRVLLVLSIIVIIAGMVMIKVNGFNYGLLYSKNQKMNIYIEKEFEISDIKEIAKEVLGNNVEVQYATYFNKVVSITANEITEEKQDEIINKIQEKYEIEEISKDDDIVIMDIPQISFFDIIGNYILPIIIITAISLLYLMIRFRKQGILQSLVIPLISILIVCGLYISIFALARIPVNDLFVVFAILAYLLTLIANTIRLNKMEEK